MNTEKSSYIFIYSTVMVLIIASGLTVVALKLKPAQENNIRIEKMQNILTAVNITSTTVNAEELFKKNIVNSFVVNIKGDTVKDVNAFDVNLADELKKENPDERNLPVFVCKSIENDTLKYYIVPLRGKGLWGPIWGYISFLPDFNTIYGCIFDHKGETPGLGAEISTANFQKEFFNKKIFEGENLVSITVCKGGAKPDDIHGVDAISGGTITSKGLEKTIRDCLTSYTDFFKKSK